MFWAALGLLEGTGPASTPVPPIQQGAGRGNLRDVWTFSDPAYEVRAKGKRKAYKTAQAATTALREAAKAGEPVALLVRGEPVNLPELQTANYAEVFARIAEADRLHQAAADEVASRLLLIRKLREQDDEEALILALARLWRL